jgi:hypothetical protein
MKKTIGAILGVGAAGALFAVLAFRPASHEEERLRGVAMGELAGMSFAAAAEPGACDENCAAKQAGFAFAKQAALVRPNDCGGKGDEDFVEGCRQYGEYIEAAIETALSRQR